MKALLTRQEPLQIFNQFLQPGHLLRLLLAPLLICLMACETGLPQRKVDPSAPPPSQEFTATYESVWRAAQISLRYPIAINNMDTGQLETDWIRALEGFMAPDQKKPPSSGIRYKLNLSLVRGKRGNRPSVRVVVRKKMERQRDFFSDPENLVSDGLEEKVILYRIERELILQEGLKKIPDA